MSSMLAVIVGFWSGSMPGLRKMALAFASSDVGLPGGQFGVSEGPGTGEKYGNMEIDVRIL